MNTLFGIIMILSFFAIPYYGIRRVLTKKSKPDVYSKIKKRIWYAIAILVVSVIGVTATQSPTNATTKHSQSTKVTRQKKSAASKKLDDARLNVDGLFSDSKHTKLVKGISHKDIKSVSKDVDVLKDSKTKDKLKKDILKAETLWTALKEKRKRESASESHEKAVESSKAEEAKKASESVAASESAARASSESAQRVAESNSIAESNAAAQAASESARQASEAAAAQAASAQAATPATTGADTTTNQGVIIGNTRSHIYHVPGQATYHMSSSNMITFPNEQAAIAAGYRKSER